MSVYATLRKAPGRLGSARANSGFRVVVLSALLLAGCAMSPSAMQGPSAAADPMAVYTRSIYDSAVLDPGNIYPLHAVPSEAGSVEIVIWTTTSTADRYYPIGAVPLGRDVWVTLAPQVQNLCQAYPKEEAALRLRLQQLLGLPPAQEERVFVVMAAATSAIFRPCMDPDPTTSVCGVSFPENTDARHKNWIGQQMIDRYQVPPDGYPWTRLGYTYDWNPDSGKLGASEYIVRKGATVRVLAKTESVDYCHPE